MTARDDAVAALDAAIAEGASEATAAQALADQPVIDALQQQLAAASDANTALEAQDAALQAQIATLQAELAEVRTVRYGASIGGYWSLAKEPKATAYARITAGFGRLQAVRVFGSVPSYVDPAATVFLDAAATPATIEQLAARQTISYLSTNHEPENDGVTAEDWQAVQVAAAAACAQYGQGRVRYVPTLMGGTFMPKRKTVGNYTLAQWLDFDLTNVWAIGADSYQWGKNDAGADTAATVLQPVIDAARSRGKHVVIGELGARRPNPPYSPGISDSARAQFLTDAIALLDANRDVVDLACYFESDNGQADMKPWCLLSPPGTAAASALSLAANVWRAACTR